MSVPVLPCLLGIVLPLDLDFPQLFLVAVEELVCLAHGKGYFGLRYPVLVAEMTNNIWD